MGYQHSRDVQDLNGDISNEIIPVVVEPIATRTEEIQEDNTDSD